MPLKLVCADADRSYCEILSRAFQAEGYEVRTAHDGDSALRLIQEEPPDLVTLDVLLPKQDGFRVLESLRGNGASRELPVLLLSGCSASPSYKSRAAKLQASALLTKPVPIERLVELVSKQLGTDRATRSARRRAPRRQSSDLTGALHELSFPALLHQLHGMRATGVLHLQSGKKKKRVQLRDGIPTAVKSNLVTETLGNLLVASGTITRDVLHESLERVKSGEGLHGQILVAMHMLDEKDLAKALHRQAEEKLLELFSWESGDYRFQRGVRIKGGNRLVLKSSPATLVLRGVRQRVARERIDAFFQEHVDDRPVPSRSPYYRFQDIALDDADRGFFESIDGERTLGDLLPLDDHARSLIYGLCAIEMLEMSREARAPVASFDRPKSKRRPIPRPSARPAKERHRTPTPDEPLPDDTDPALGGEDAQLRAELTELASRFRDQDHFDVLGVARNATDADVQRAFHALAKQTHPDRFRGSGEPVKRLAEEVFAHVHQAFETIETTEKRVSYTQAERNRERDAEVIEEGHRALKAEVAFQKGLGFLKRKSNTESVRHFRDAVEAYPEEGEYHAYLGWSIFLADPESREEARQHLLRARKLAPDNEKPYLFLGRLYKAADRVSQAEKLFSRAVELDPDCVDAIRELRLIDMRRAKSKGFVRRLLRR